MKLFYIPHAGGSAKLIEKWTNGLEEFIELVPIELAGRGLRFGEPPYTSFKETIEDIFNCFKEKSGDDDYIIVGHSMGATLAYELYYKIVDSNRKEPLHIFFSGSKPPRTRQENEKTVMLDEDQFMEKMKKYGGFSEEMLRIKKFRKLFLPLLRADFCVLEDYEFKKRKSKIKCSISVMYGKEDLSYEDVKGWSQLADSCFYREFDGGHFYIEHNIEEFSSYINRKVKELCMKRQSGVTLPSDSRR